MFSCTNLDETLFSQIPSDVFPENDAQIAARLLVIYDRLPGWPDWAGWFFLQEVTADAITVPTRATDWDDDGKWRELHQHNWTDQTEALTQAWPELFRGIMNTNMLIDGMAGELDSPEPNPIILRNLAIVKAMRAYYYYVAIDLYGDVPFITSFVHAPALPYRNYRADIWDSLIRDLEWVVEHLPEGRGSRAAVNRGMVYSLMAKLFLNAEVFTSRDNGGTADVHGFWASAEYWSNRVIELGYSLNTDIRGPFLANNRGCPENIFVVDFDEDLRHGFNLHMRTLHYDSDQTFGMTLGPWNGFAFQPAFFNTFEETDLRRDAWFLYGPQYTVDGAPLFDGTTRERVDFFNDIPALIMSAATHGDHVLRNAGVRANKFEVRRGAGQNLGNQFPIFRLADIYLMKSEALIRQGLNGDEWVNRVRARAGVAPFSGADLDDILAERGRELVWEGHRRQDLIRFGRFGDAWWEKPASGPEREIFFIPRQQVAANPNLALPPRR